MINKEVKLGEFYFKEREYYLNSDVVEKQLKEKAEEYFNINKSGGFIWANMK